MKLPDVVLFDLDGTLIDSVPDLTTALNRMLQELSMSPVEQAIVHNWVGDGSRLLVHRAMTGRIDGRIDDDVAEKAYRIFQDHYADCCLEETRIFDHAEALIKTLRDRGVKTAIVTNKPERHAIHLMNAWSEQLPMDVVLGEVEGRPRKPDPTMLLEAKKRCVAETAWMVGDSEVDGQAARAIDADFIGVRLGYNHGRDIADMIPPPDQVFDELGSFLSWFESL